jgi:tRNA dimethylallyltransferase
MIHWICRTKTPKAIPGPVKNTLIVLCGPTAIGKTVLAIDLAKRYSTEIVSADSRQIYKELIIGTAAPTAEEQSAVPHHFVGFKNITENYNAFSFELEVLHFLETHFKRNPIAVMAGGSGLYINAVCRGIDELPDPDEALRQNLKETLKNRGLDYLGKQLQELDPNHYQIVDRNNPNRILRALEVCIQTGVPYSTLRTNTRKSRDFKIIKIGLEMPRDVLVERIHQRVDRMMRDGLLEEVKSLLPHRSQNALNTVGYKELFAYLDGKVTLKEAIEKIKTNTRRYAKRQMTWFKKDPEIHWFQVTQASQIHAFLDERIHLSGV